MKKLLLLSFAVLVMFFWIFPANAKTLDVATEYKDTIGQYIQVYQSGDGYLSKHDAFDAFRNGHFSLSDNPVINFGVGSKPVWLALQISNSGKIAMHRNLLIETAWLDKIDVHYFQQEQLINSYHTGDSLLFAERPINRRFFVMGHDFTQGETTVLIRVESADAMVLPIYLLDNEKLNDRDRVQAYSYGFMYGVILALVAYNLCCISGYELPPICFIQSISYSF
ncbi:7TM-DISM domain-containing protein [Nitrosomonas sp.]|uniref:7TMR-DISMED2 domain-containing protein n=1 Tax=Nitrosomonas sp. TaxID=42353 RepID=UPI00374D88F2